MGANESALVGGVKAANRFKRNRHHDDTSPDRSTSRQTRPRYRAPQNTEEDDNLPDVKPPTKTKAELLEDIDFRVIDEHACKAPNDLLVKSFWDLAKYLSDDNAWNDLVKVRAIFRWITSYDIKKIKIEKTPPPDTPLEYFNKIQCDMGNHAYLFFILCHLLEVPCVVIDGMAKNKDYKIGEPLEPEELAAQWNAVYVMGEWRLVDAYWGITCVKVESGRDMEYDDDGDLISVQDEYYVDEDDDDFSQTEYAKIIHREPVDDQYFFPDPRQLIWTHFPDEERWQLTKNPISEKEWEEQLYMRERTHEMGIKVTKRKHGKAVIDAKDGKASIILWLPEARSDLFRFRHSFTRCEATHEKRQIDKILHRFIIFDHLKDRIHFKCMLPVPGRFQLTIYGKDTADPELDEFDLICTYIIVSTLPDKEQPPLPDYPKIGWGPCTKTAKAHLIPISHTHADIETDTGILEIKLEGSKDLKLQMKLKSHIIDDANISKYALLRWHAGEYIIDTRFKYPGVYAMMFYAIMDGHVERVNVLNYLITVTGRASSTTPFPTVTQGRLGEDPDVYKLGVTSFQFETGFIEAREGHTKLSFGAKEGVLLLCELHSNNREAAERMRVVPKAEGSKQCFYLDLPIEGEYSINIHAKKRTSPGKLYHAFAYLIHSTGRAIEKGQTNTTKGNSNRSFWRDCTEIHTETIETKDNDVCVPVPRGIESLEVYLEKKESHEPPSSKSIVPITEKGVDLYKVAVDDIGEYFINVYERKNLEFLKSKAKYIVRKIHMDDVEEKDFNEVMEIIRQERIRAGKDVSQTEKLRKQIQEAKASKIGVNERIILTQQLKEAIDAKNRQQLRRAINEYQYIKPAKNDDLLQQAIKLLQETEFKEELLNAYKDQDVQALDRILKDADKKISLDPITKQRVALAKRLRDRLSAKNNLRDMVLETNINTITELRKLHTPPEPVKKTIMAALIVLGHSLKDVENWKTCLALLGKRDQDSLRRRMADINPADVKREHAFYAKDLIEPYTADKLRFISPTAAAFYLWTAEVIRELEAMSGKLPEKKVPPPKQKPPPLPRVQTPPPPPAPSPKKKKEPKMKFVTLDGLDSLISKPANQPTNVEETENKNTDNKSTDNKNASSPDIKDRSESRTYSKRFQRKNDFMATKRKPRPNSDVKQVKEINKAGETESPNPLNQNNKGKDTKAPESPRKGSESPRKAKAGAAQKVNKDPGHPRGKATQQQLDSEESNDDKKDDKETKDKNNNNNNSKDKQDPKKSVDNTSVPRPDQNDQKMGSPMKKAKGKPVDTNENYKNPPYDRQTETRPTQPDILEIKHDDDIEDEKIDPNGYKARFMRKKNYMQSRGQKF